MQSPDSLSDIFLSPLGRRLFVSIVLFSSLITLIITALQIHNDYRLELSTIEQQFQQVENSRLEGIAQGVWVIDEIQVKKLIQGLKQLPYIEYVGISIDGTLKWSEGEAEVNNEIGRRFPLTYKHRGKNLAIGTLEIKGSLDDVYVRLLRKVFFILLSNALKTALVALFILFLFYHLLGKHIIRLASFANHFGKGDDLPQFQLQRKQSEHQKTDELNQLEESVNRMVDTLQRRESDLRVLATTVEQSPNSIILTDPQGCIEYINSKLSEVTGYVLDEVKGKNPRLFGSGQTPRSIYHDLWQTIQAGNVWTGELYNKKKSGELYWESARVAPVKNDAGVTLHYVAIKEDITLQKSYEEQLLHQANFDNLTNLPNRLLAVDRISQALISHHRDKGHVVIMFIDLDRFKNINDTLGHGCGDQLLVDASLRLRSAIRVEDTIARFGGDEFLVVLPNISTTRSAEIIAEKIGHSMTEPFLLESREVYVTASIGITVYPEDGDTPQILLRNADSAMYQAKDEGRNSHCFFTPSMNEQAKNRMEMESELRQAQYNNEFEIHFQPIIDANSKRLVCAEALLRWHNQKLGNVPPSTFIPLAEDIGLILPIGAWVLHQSCTAAAAWQQPGKKPLRISVNVSARQFRAGDIVKTISNELEVSGLPPHCLEIEITEGLLLDDALEIQSMLSRLHQMGVRLSIDDFGTGYSALGYLKKFSFHTLKIDRSFVSDITSNSEDAALATAIINMAHGLKLEVVGEGVETEAQFNYLQEQGVDMVQGFLFSRPLPIDNFERLLNLRDEAMVPAEQRTNSSLN
ncbi:MAG: EAL domain-containing protein [Candidatus Sedimenticola sp. (ex Thyasira tokunagai)]